MQELTQIEAQRAKYFASEISTNVEQIDDLSSQLQTLEHGKNKNLHLNLISVQQD